MFSLPSISCLPDAKLTLISSVLPPAFFRLSTPLFGPTPNSFGHISQVPGMMTVRHGGFVKNADCFDASFFGLSPAESKVMDPQQRLLLEVIYQSFHASGKLGPLTSKNWGRWMFFWRLGIRCLFGNGVHVVEESVLSWYFCLEWGTRKSDPATKPRVWHQYNDGLLTGIWCPPNRTSSSVP